MGEDAGAGVSVVVGGQALVVNGPELRSFDTIQKV